MSALQPGLNVSPWRIAAIPLGHGGQSFLRNASARDLSRGSVGAMVPVGEPNGSLGRGNPFR